MRPLICLLCGAFLLALGLLPVSRAAQQATSDAKADLQTLVQGNNEFAFDLYRRLAAKQKGNLIFSPYSISTALAMTYAGARGETAEQMAKVLHFTLGQERLHPAFGELMADLHKEGQRKPFPKLSGGFGKASGGFGKSKADPPEQERSQLFDLHIANSLWGQKGYPFLQEFLQQTRNNYRAALEELDFVGDPESARNTINRWVEEQTKDKIKELALPGDVTPNTRLALVNAIYFKGAWEKQFPKTQTKDTEFAVTPTEKVPVAMMHLRETVPYFEADGFQWLELPYKGDRLAMVILLPKKQGQLAQLEKTLSGTTLQKGIEQLRLSTGSVVLPRFQATLRFNLTEELKQMGMVLPFTNADFSGMTPGGGLRISKVVHKAYIDVDEVGTEAAAATGGFMAVSGGFSFHANHPFLFLIRDKQTGNVLFLGRVTDPRSGD